ncbi:MAG: folate-binding protein YgfZ [Pseudohongiellaceae bacterium]|jgi:folate-binding protein YgfZ
MNTTLQSLITNNINTLIRLPYSFLTITGIDAEKFLQGQFTSDLATITNDTIQFSTVNTPKGRMYGLFKIVRIESGFLIRLESSTLEQFLKNITKYKVFFKCEIKIEEQLLSFGYQALTSNEKNLPQQNNELQRTGSEFISRLSDKQALFEIWSSDLSLDKITTALDPEIWFAKEAQLGIPELYAATQDCFILQYLNLHELGAVSFKKGCYTGQEIIARMKFLGKLKKKMYLLSSPIKEIAEAGSNIYDDNGKKCGLVVRSHWSDQTGSVTLGILNTNYSDSVDKMYISPEKKAPFMISQINYEI